MTGPIYLQCLHFSDGILPISYESYLQSELLGESHHAAVDVTAALRSQLQRCLMCFLFPLCPGCFSFSAVSSAHYTALLYQPLGEKEVCVCVGGNLCGIILDGLHRTAEFLRNVRKKMNCPLVSRFRVAYLLIELFLGCVFPKESWIY